MEQIEKVNIDCTLTEWLYVPDVVYTDVNAEVERKLQLLFPFNREWNDEKDFSSHLFPLIVFLPGAAWYRQEMYNSIPAYSKLAKKDLVLAAVQVRESTIAPYPEPVKDVKTAIRFLIKNAEQFRVDPKNVFIMGNSSGGHIALMTAYSWANGDLESECYTDIQYTINGVIAECAPTDMSLLGGAPSLSLLGIESLDTDPDKVRKASCAYYVKSVEEVKLPPTMLCHCPSDPIVSVKHSERLYELLAVNNQEGQYIEIMNAGHCGMNFWSDEMLKRIRRFVERYSE